MRFLMVVTARALAVSSWSLVLPGDDPGSGVSAPHRCAGGSHQAPEGGVGLRRGLRMAKLGQDPACVCACLYAFMHVCMHVCGEVCAYVCMYVTRYARVCVHVCSWT